LQTHDDDYDDNDDEDAEHVNSSNAANEDNNSDESESDSDSGEESESESESESDEKSEEEEESGEDDEESGEEEEESGEEDEESEEEDEESGEEEEEESEKPIPESKLGEQVDEGNKVEEHINAQAIVENNSEIREIIIDEKINPISESDLSYLTNTIREMQVSADGEAHDVTREVIISPKAPHEVIPKRDKKKESKKADAFF
jgi:hypothetical protein